MINTKRLMKLANHLLKGKLGHKYFDFNYYNTNGNAVCQPNSCGFSGCALGEMPIIWPKDWRFHGNHITSIDNKQSQYDWFGIKHDDYSYLFVPQVEHYNKLKTSVGYRVSKCGLFATKEQVAKQIIKFVKDYEKIKGIKK